MGCLCTAPTSSRKLHTKQYTSQTTKYTQPAAAKEGDVECVHLLTYPCSSTEGNFRFSCTMITGNDTKVPKDPQYWLQKQTPHPRHACYNFLTRMRNNWNDEVAFLSPPRGVDMKKNEKARLLWAYALLTQSGKARAP